MKTPLFAKPAGAVPARHACRFLLATLLCSGLALSGCTRFEPDAAKNSAQSTLKQPSLPGQTCSPARPQTGLVGLLDETLVIWGGEFGRTSYTQGELTKDNYGRDHHPRCFTVWMAGGGIKPGIVYGETDELGYNIIKDPVHVHDFQATVLNQMGLDHKKLIFKHLGRRYRLTDISGEVVSNIIS